MTHSTLTHAALQAHPDVEAYLVDVGINLLAGSLILIVGWWLSRRLGAWTATALDRVRNFDATLKPLIATLVRYVVLVAALIAVLERFGVETTSLITLLGTAGLAVGLAVQGTLSNVSSGVMLLMLRPFRVGDWITVVAAAQSGTVREIGLFTTTLISADHSYVSLPNSMIFASAIVNASREPLTRLNFTISVDPENDVDAALELIHDALAADERIRRVPPPSTGIASLRDNTVELLVRCWVHNADGEAVKLDLHKAIRDRFQRGGIALSAPTQLRGAANGSSPPQKSPM